MLVPTYQKKENLEVKEGSTLLFGRGALYSDRSSESQFCRIMCEPI